MKNIRAVIFDMDGLILDSEKIAFKCFKKVLSEYGYEMSESYYLTLIGTNSKGTKEAMLNRYGSWFPFEVIYEEVLNLIAKEIEENGVDLKAGVIELIDYLIECGYKIAVATSTHRSKAEKLLKLVNVKDKLNFIICGDDIVDSKPNPEIFLKAAQGLGVDPKECIVLEDSKAGIEAAFRAGMKGINIPDMKKPDSEMKDKAFKIFDSLLDVKKYIENNR